MAEARNKIAEEPQLIAGGLAVDDRGAVGFVNEFDFAGVQRFYTVKNHRAGMVRAWHAHRRILRSRRSFAQSTRKSM